MEYGRIPSSRDIMALKGNLTAAVRNIHSEWEQDVDGHDDVYWTGGICQDIADATIDVLHAAGVEDAIPPNLYETGSGYVWRKRLDAVIGAADVPIDRIGDPVTPEAFESLNCE
jgi:hypothetical protein